MNETVIILDDERAKYWIECQKYEQAIKRLLDCKVFELCPGNAILHFDKGKILTEVDMNIKFRFDKT